MAVALQIDPKLLRRCDWIYIWRVEHVSNGVNCLKFYVGITNSASVFARASRHLSFSVQRGQLRRRLRSHNISPEDCKSLSLIAVALDEEMANQKRCLEAELARKLQAAGLIMLSKPDGRPPGPETWQRLMDELSDQLGQWNITLDNT